MPAPPAAVAASDPVPVLGVVAPPVPLAPAPPPVPPAPAKTTLMPDTLPLRSWLDMVVVLALVVVVVFTERFELSFMVVVFTERFELSLFESLVERFELSLVFTDRFE